jgi:4-hydroxybenzoate polyprenyltransferase
MSRALQAEGASASISSVRAVGCVDHWWCLTVAPPFVIPYCSARIYHVPAWATAGSVLLIAFVGVCAGSYGQLVNDVFDVEVDRRAGKQNHTAGFAPWKQFLIYALALGLGFKPTVLVFVLSHQPALASTDVVLCGRSYPEWRR